MNGSSFLWSGMLARLNLQTVRLNRAKRNCKKASSVSVYAFEIADIHPQNEFFELSLLRLLRERFCPFRERVTPAAERGGNDGRHIRGDWRASAATRACDRVAPGSDRPRLPRDFSPRRGHPIATTQDRRDRAARLAGRTRAIRPSVRTLRRENDRGTIVRLQGHAGSTICSPLCGSSSNQGSPSRTPKTPKLESVRGEWAKTSTFFVRVRNCAISRNSHFRADFFARLGGIQLVQQLQQGCCSRWVRIGGGQFVRPGAQPTGNDSRG